MWSVGAKRVDMGADGDLGGERKALPLFLLLGASICADIIRIDGARGKGLGLLHSRL